MENVKNAINLIERLEEKYGLSSENIKNIKSEFEESKVYVPLIGKFSVGKSALINNLINFGDDFELCTESITVETAIPTEVFYGEEDLACLCGKDKKSNIPIQYYLENIKILNPEEIETVRLQINGCDNLEQIKNVAIVDLPGLDSGYEKHDLAIEQYLRKSMAFALVFAADELTIPKTMEPILNDLNTYDIPMCAVITKGKRIRGHEDESKAVLRNNLSKYFDKEIEICITEREGGYVKEFLDFLVKLDLQSTELGTSYYKKRLQPEFAKVLNYLNGCLKNMDLSLSQLEEEKYKLEESMTKLNDSVSKELNVLVSEIPVIANGVANDVQAALSQNIESLAYDAVDGSNINNSISNIVKNALNASYQKRVNVKIKQHLDKIQKAMSESSDNYTASMYIDMSNVLGEGFNGVGKTAIIAVSVLLGPIGWIGGAFIINKIKEEKRRQQLAQAKQVLSGTVFPKIDMDVREKVTADLTKTIEDVKISVENELISQNEVLKKSLDEVIARKQLEDENKDNIKLDIENDIKLLENAENTL